MRRNRKLLLIGGVGAVLVAAATLAAFGRAPAAELEDAAPFAFRNAVNPPPLGWTGPVFELSHDYPRTRPAPCAPDVCPWLHMDVPFTTSPTDTVPQWRDPAWNAYIASILTYIRHGQDPHLSNEAGFRTAVDGRRWFHVPWMAYDPHVGREFVHGTTNERTAHLSDLIGDGSGSAVHMLPGGQSCAEAFPDGFETWSVGVYNEFGGWSIGQAFPEDGRPRTQEYMGSRVAAGLPFPEGTVVVKFLTTNAPPECVPFLRGSPEWQINRHARDASGGYEPCRREVQISRLVQVDVAVVDPRSPSGWVYGTFAYNGNIHAHDAWDRLAPMGLQWGSDPWTFPAVPQSESVPARQSVLNRDIGIYEHWGCNGRLAGPADNAMASCLSCHASAFAVPGGQPVAMGVNAPPAFGFPGLCTQFSLDNMEYFKNIVTPQAYSGQYAHLLSLDTSLQLQVAFDQYGVFNTQGAPRSCPRT